MEARELSGSGAKSLEIVGREAELAVLAHLVREASMDSGRAAVIEGEPGIGKSSIVTAVCRSALADGFAVCHAVGEQFQKDHSFRVILQALVGQLSRKEDHRRIAHILREPPVEFGSDQRFKVVEAIEDALEREAQTRPVLVSIDDAQWADSGSLLTMQALARRTDLRVLLLLCCRPVPRPAELKNLIDDLFQAGARELRLLPLDDQQVAELVCVRLGSRPGETLTQQLGRAGGNPLFVLELLEGLVEESMLQFKDGVVDSERAVQPPPSLRALIIRRLSFLQEESLEAMRTAAVLGDSFSAEELAAVTGMPLARSLECLREPVAAGIVDASGELFSFQHDVVREALYDDLAPALRKGLHLHVGRTLAACGASKVRIAQQLALGAEVGDREAVTWMREAALEVGPRDPDLAVELLDRAVALLLPDDPERDGLLLEQVLRLMFVGQLDRASQLADELRRRLAGTPLVGMVDLQRLGILSLQFRVEEMARLADEILEGDSLPEDFRMQALVASAAARLAGGDVQGTIARMEEVRPYTEANPTSAATGLYRWIAAGLLIYSGRFGLAAEKLTEALPSTEMLLGGRGQGLDFVGYGYSLGTDDFERARLTLEEGRSELEGRGARSYIVEYHWLRANLEFIAGNWDDALVEMTAASDLGSETGTFGMAIGAAPDPTILISLFRGDTAGAEEALRLLDRFQAEMFVAHWLEPIRALVQDDRGDRPGALVRLRNWHQDMVRTSFVPDLRTVGLSLARLYKEAGEEDLMAAVVRGAREAHERADGLKSMEAATLLVEGAIHDDLDRLLLAVDAARLAGRPFDLAESCGEASASLLRSGNVEEGRRLGMEAWGIYEDLGAARQEAALALALRDLGVRRGSRQKRGRPAIGWDSLTTSERRIVALVGEGLTNREIGERLFVSRGTVATHLRNIFRKLEMSSRTELATGAARRGD